MITNLMMSWKRYANLDSWEDVKKVLYPCQQVVYQVIQTPFKLDILGKRQSSKSVSGYKGGDYGSLRSESKRSRYKNNSCLIIHKRPTPTTLANVVLENFPFAVWPQGHRTSSLSGSLSTTQTSLVKVGLFGLYHQIKEDNVDLRKILFPKKDIDMGHQEKMIFSLYFIQGTLKLAILDKIPTEGKKILQITKQHKSRLMWMDFILKN